MAKIYAKHKIRPGLDVLIEASRKHTMTNDELEEQRRSWVSGEIALGSDRDEERYRAALDRDDKEEIARLNAKAR